jgi:membrane protein YdbS with pleckstrin-like domain
MLVYAKVHDSYTVGEMQIDLTRSHAPGKESKSASLKRLSKDLLLKVVFVACVVGVVMPTRLWMTAWSSVSSAAVVVVMSLAVIGLAMALIKSLRSRERF